jgi:hypothetical protein
MTTTRQPLNLDELFGQATFVTIIKDGARYDLSMLEALGPEQIVRFQRLRVEANELQRMDVKDPSTEDAERLTKAVDDMLKILCEKLPLSKMTFMEKSRVLEYYFAETQSKKAPKLALEKVRRPTGARSSRR